MNVPAVFALKEEQFQCLLSQMYEFDMIVNITEPLKCLTMCACQYQLSILCLSINLFSNTVESRDYAPPFCMLALGKSGEGAYTRDRDISA